MNDEEMKEMNETLSAAAAQCRTEVQYGGGAMGGALNGPAMDNLMGRIASQCKRAQRSAMKAERLGELQYLLDKNPEVARILTLLEEVDKHA